MKTAVATPTKRAPRETLNLRIAAEELALLESHPFRLFDSATGVRRAKQTVFAPPARQNSVAHPVAK